MNPADDFTRLLEAEQAVADELQDVMARAQATHQATLDFLRAQQGGKKKSLVDCVFNEILPPEKHHKHWNTCVRCEKASLADVAALFETHKGIDPAGFKRKDMEQFLFAKN